MNVLIVESNLGLAGVWAEHIRRLGGRVDAAATQEAGVEALQDRRYDVIVLNLELSDGSSMAVADYASYRQPDSKVVFVTSRSFFSDGSIFSYMGNACALIPQAMQPADMAALVDYHAHSH